MRVRFLTSWHLIQLFYSRIQYEHRFTINTTYGGDMSSKIEDELYALFETIAQKSSSLSNKRETVVQSLTKVKRDVMKALTC